MKIQSIKRTKYNNCYTIFESGEKISLSMDIAVKYKLKVGLEIESLQFEKMCNEQKTIEAKRKAHNFISYRPRSEFEVRRKLKFLKYNSEVIENTISFLYEFDYLNDEKFALLFAKDIIKSKPAGKKKIQIELKKKGIEESIIDNTIAMLFEEEYDTYDLIRKATKKKLKQVAYKDIDKQKTSIMNFLQRQGFDYSDITDVMREIF